MSLTTTEKVVLDYWLKNPFFISKHKEAKLNISKQGEASVFFFTVI